MHIARTIYSSAFHNHMYTSSIIRERHLLKGEMLPALPNNSNLASQRVAPRLGLGPTTELTITTSRTRLT
jgi:hypothetical protein